MSKEQTKEEKPSSKMLIRLVDENRVAEVKSQDKFKQILNIEPPKQWVKEHPYAKGVEYLPIDKVEILLDTIFQEWRCEIKSISQLAQSIVCIVRVHYKNPVNNEWSYCDGTGAVPLKTDKGYAASDLEHIKSDAVQTGAPAAESYAIKDAVEHLGKIFGRDLNREDAVSFSGVYANSNVEIKPRETGHRSGVDIEYAQLRHRLDNVDLIYALGETEELSEQQIDDKITELKARESAQIAKNELKTTAQREVAQEFLNSQMERQVERAAGYTQ